MALSQTDCLTTRLRLCAHYYNSRTGTFCSADPLAGDPSDPQSWNRYPYGRNNPIGNVDPSGQGWLSDLFSGFFETLMVAAGGWPVAAMFTLQDITGDLMGFRNGPPSPMGFSIGASSSGVWNDSFSVPYGGLTNGIQTALGLPTMADVGGPINNFQDALSQQQINGLVDTTALLFSWRCKRAFKAVGKATGVPFSINSFRNNLKSGPFDQEPSIYDPNATAETNQGSSGPNSTAMIHLYHGFYSEDPSTQGFTLFHEETHRYFGIKDYQYPGGDTRNFDTLFAPYGYRRQPGEGSNAFTKWLKGGCK